MEAKSNNLLIITSDKYPDGDAGSVREHIFAKIFTEIGYEVSVIGFGISTSLKYRSYDSINYVSLRRGENKFIDKILSRLFYTYNLKNIIDKVKNKIDIILVTDLPVSSIILIRIYAKKYGIKLMHDSVEWYSPDQFRFNFLSINYQKKNLYNSFLINRSFKVIAISTFLKKHFELRGIKTIVIPSIEDKNKFQIPNKNVGEKTVFLYAGSPGKKDYIRHIIDGFALLSDYELSKIHFKLIGVNRDYLIKICKVSSDSLSKISKSLLLFERMTRDEVIRNLNDANYTVLLRPVDKRYAKAGFPTKVTESLMSSTPVILNITSDLGSYINNFDEGIIVDECTAESFSIAVRKAISLNEPERKYMYLKARECAERKLDYRLFITEIEKFLIEF